MANVPIFICFESESTMTIFGTEKRTVSFEIKSNGKISFIELTEEDCRVIIERLKYLTQEYNG